MTEKINNYYFFIFCIILLFIQKIYTQHLHEKEIVNITEMYINESNDRVALSDNLYELSLNSIELNLYFRNKFIYKMDTNDIHTYNGYIGNMEVYRDSVNFYNEKILKYEN